MTKEEMIKQLKLLGEFKATKNCIAWIGQHRVWDRLKSKMITKRNLYFNNYEELFKHMVDKGVIRNASQKSEQFNYLKKLLHT